MVRIRGLPNKPLVEAILELKWDIDPDKGDPNYSLLVGQLYSILGSKYPYHEPMPASMVPEQMAGNLVQHRFRVEKGKWPLVQIGPGVVTLNDTVNYTWNDFSKRANELVKAFFKAHLKQEEIKVNRLLLRYIDAVQIEHVHKSVLDFLKEKLKVELAVPKQLFDNSSTLKRPKSFNFVVAHETKKPKGTITLRFGTGTSKGKRAIVWETAVESKNEELPNLPGGFDAWVKAAHEITDDWFFKLIEGELEREFAGE